MVTKKHFEERVAWLHPSTICKEPSYRLRGDSFIQFGLPHSHSRIWLMKVDGSWNSNEIWRSTNPLAETLKPIYSHEWLEYGHLSQKMSTLNDDLTVTYANTPTEIRQIVRFVFDGLKPVRIADSKPKDHECLTCAAAFATDVYGLHRPVRLPRRHTFGESCIRKRLSSFVP